MSELALGEIIHDPAAVRDAIHVAVAPVEAGQKLAPGQGVGADGTTDDPIGIVDPYLQRMVMPGERFWLFLYPNTVTGMRHHWAHPAFPSETTGQEASRFWLTDFAKRLTDADRYDNKDPEHVITYDDVLRAGKTGDFCLPFDTPDFVWNEAEEFWRHYGVVTGDTSRAGDYSPFRCAC